MTAATGWGELELPCYACGALVTVCGYIGDLRPDDPYRCLGCRHAIQDARGSRPKRLVAVPYNEFPEGY